MSSSSTPPTVVRPRRVQVRAGDSWFSGYVWDWSVDDHGTWWAHVWCRGSVGELPRLRTFRRSDVLNAEPGV